MKYLPIVQLCLITLLSSAVYAQDKCGTGPSLIPENAQGVADLQNIRTRIANAPFAKQQGDTLIFPTVVHIIHLNGVGNITDAQVADGLRIINEDFNRENPDTAATKSVFKPFASAVGFKFVLAKLDSVGDSTSGIVRIDTSATPHPEPFSSNFDNCKKISHWPANKYYNIWVVRYIQDGAAGYAQYPGTNFTYGGPWKTWGIVVRHDQWGTIGTSNADGRTGTHEVGHTFGLYHTFLNTSAGCGSICDTTGDEVCDTPPNTLTTSCSQFSNTCSNDTLGTSFYDSNVVDQIENYMSYNSCQNMFSEGQKNRMRGFVASFPTLVGLSSDSNLLATGIIDEIPIGIADNKELVSGIRVSPNPFVSNVNVVIETTGKQALYKIRVVNVLGQEVDFSIQTSTLKYKKQHLTLKMDSNLNPGVYFLILNVEGSTLVQKLIKN